MRFEVVAKAKRDSRHILGDKGLPKLVYHPDLDDPACVRAFMEGLDRLLAEQRPPSPTGEIHLFKAMHYGAHRARKARGKRTAVTAAAARWVRRRNRIRDHLITVNLGLSYEMLRRTRFTNVDEDELLSEGLRALCDAVEAFDPWRGYRFSTYACNSIYRGFLRLSKMETRRSTFISFGYDGRLERGVWETDPAEWDERVYAERLNRLMQDNGADLTSLEQYVLNQRFPEQCSQKRATLETIGRDIQVSKERVRQMQVSALEKLRTALLAEPVFS
jgi:RNA polymerase sigma factor (sigma-70 family)